MSYLMVSWVFIDYNQENISFSLIMIHYSHFYCCVCTQQCLVYMVIRAEYLLYVFHSFYLHVALVAKASAKSWILISPLLSLLPPFFPFVPMVEEADGHPVLLELIIFLFSGVQVPSQPMALALTPVPRLEGQRTA